LDSFQQSKARQMEGLFLSASCGHSENKASDMLQKQKPHGVNSSQSHNG